MIQKSVLVVGTGTIGEPLIALLCRLKDKFDVGEVIFHKRTPLQYEKAKVNSLISMGANLAVDKDKIEDFRALGHDPKYTWTQALKKSKVIIDCTPAGNENKEKYYSKYRGKLFIAQGSEKGFGVAYALGLTDKKVIDGEKGYIQVVSCNTHAIARIIESVSQGKPQSMIDGDFTCIRRANDVSQDKGFSPSTTAGKHTDPVFGTHHARDVSDLFDLAIPLPVFSSALKANTQYMHSIRFSIELPEPLTHDEVVDRFALDEFVCMTDRMTANSIFSFGRDHGFYGRIYSQVVICEPSLIVKTSSGNTKVTGVAFTPQDGNSLMTSMAACLYGIHGNKALHGKKFIPELKNMMIQTA